MPSKRTSAPKKTTGKKVPFDKIKWVFNNLSKEQKDAFLERDSKDTFLTFFGQIDRILDAGGKISIRTDTYNGGIQVSVVFDTTDTVNSGLATSARHGSSSLFALQVLLFKYFICAEERLADLDFDDDEFWG